MADAMASGVLHTSRTIKTVFFVHRRDLIGRHIAKYGSHEPVLTRWISDYLATSSRGLFVDVGANLGWYAVHAAQHTAVETVIAFEPDSFNGWLLDRNLSLNGIDNVIVNPYPFQQFQPLTAHRELKVGKSCNVLHATMMSTFRPTSSAASPR